MGTNISKSSEIIIKNDKLGRFHNLEKDAKGRVCTPIFDKSDPSCDEIKWYESQPSYCVNCFDVNAFIQSYSPIKPGDTGESIATYQTTFDFFLELFQKFPIYVPQLMFLVMAIGGDTKEAKILKRIKLKEESRVIAEENRLYRRSSIYEKMKANIPRPTNPLKNLFITYIDSFLLTAVWQNGLAIRMMFALAISYPIETLMKKYMYNKRPNMTRGMVYDWDHMMGTDEAQMDDAEDFFVKSQGRVTGTKLYRSSFPSGHNLGAWVFFFTLLFTPFSPSPNLDKIDPTGNIKYQLNGSSILKGIYYFLLVTSVANVIFQVYARTSLGGWHWTTDILGAIGMSIILAIVGTLIYSFFIRAMTHANKYQFFLMFIILLTFVLYLPGIVKIVTPTENIVPSQTSIGDYSVGPGSDFGVGDYLGGMRAKDGIVSINDTVKICPSSKDNYEVLTPGTYYTTNLTAAQQRANVECKQ